MESSSEAYNIWMSGTDGESLVDIMRPQQLRYNLSMMNTTMMSISEIMDMYGASLEEHQIEILRKHAKQFEIEEDYGIEF